MVRCVLMSELAIVPCAGDQECGVCGTGWQVDASPLGVKRGGLLY